MRYCHKCERSYPSGQFYKNTYRSKSKQRCVLCCKIEILALRIEQQKRRLENMIKLRETRRNEPK